MDKELDFSSEIKDKLQFNKKDCNSFIDGLISFLSIKASEHNARFDSKIDLKQLKEVYKRGVYDAMRLEKPINLWAIARVNMFLKMSRGSSVPNTYKKLDRDIINDPSFFIDDGVRDDVIFTYEQISEARFESESFNLRKNDSFDFVNSEEYSNPSFPNISKEQE